MLKQIFLIRKFVVCKKFVNFMKYFVLFYYQFRPGEDHQPDATTSLTPIGSVVFNEVKAIDKDMPNRPNSQISYSVVAGQCAQYFEFPLSTRPEIAVAKLINYDSLSGCNLTIKAQDHGEPVLSSETTIEISIIDIDDKDPVFDRNFYMGSIARNSLPGTLVNMSQPIFAFDQDFGINMTLEYHLNNKN
ncbi:protocadherin Fat 4 [Brachionus plicatilis]|uniref:Protocadherin Fat 4 n=1 Tax=Brachionus plicatilis TaxID=10195 RepID=A0A3M7QUI2_BRAPC|nr:protocadherin Fat 4 [Brachionus plicatilis]